MAPESGSSTVNPNEVNTPSTDHHQDSGISRPRVRSIPPWVLNADSNDAGQTTQPIHMPEPPVVPHHQYMPDEQRKKAARGRRYDQYRTAEPAMLDQPLADSSLRWLPFMLSGPQYQARDTEGARLMPDSWMEENIAWWSPPQDDTESHHEKRRTWLLDPDRRRGSVSQAKSRLLKNPFVPLVFRLIVTCFSAAALGLGARVYHQTRVTNITTQEGCVQRASTYMDIVVNSIAIPYIAYVTWDEYTSRPLGLRSATAKIALLLLDLYFIIFYGSNLSLAFDALTDSRWACYDSSRTQTCPLTPSICHSQAALSAVLVVALIAWVITFTVSVLRVVKRLRPDE